MSISVFSILMAVFWSSGLVFIIYRVRKRNLSNRRFGITSMVVLYLFCAIRLLIPVDFTFSKGIYIKGVFTQLAIFFSRIRGVIGGYRITILSCLAIIWLIGAIIILFRFIIQYKNMLNWINLFSKWQDEQCICALEKVYLKKGKRMKISVYKSADVQIPIGCGIISKKIVLPDRKFNDLELYYICLHEYTHFLNQDLLVKMLIHIFCCFFWWNPVAYLLRKDLDQTLEIKCDLCATENLQDSEKADYLQTIIQTLKFAENKRRNSIIHGVVALTGNPESEVVERFRVVLAKRDSYAKSIRDAVILLMTFLIVLMVSYSFIILPTGQPPIDDIVTGPDTYVVTQENSYIIQENDLYYWILEEDVVIQEQISKEMAAELILSGYKIRR